jgi:hypothetical protein
MGYAYLHGGYNEYKIRSFRNCIYTKIQYILILPLYGSTVNHFLLDTCYSNGRIQTSHKCSNSPIEKVIGKIATTHLEEKERYHYYLKHIYYQTG